MNPVFFQFGRNKLISLVSATSNFNLQRLVGGVREASKKASGGTRNPKQAKGQHRGIKMGDGTYAYPNDILVHKMSRLWFHPGLNVRLAGRNNLVARKEGTVRVSCEVPDLNMGHEAVVKYYTGREGQRFFKKYFHVIPPPLHNKFKLVKEI